MEADSLETHCGIVVAQFQAGKVIPFFGAGVNMCGRPPGQAFEPGLNLPASAELAQRIADRFGADSSLPRHDLLAVAQWVELMIGPQDLYDYLHVLLDRDYTPTVLHSFFARLPRVLRDKGVGTGSQIIVTTNYDDVLERAFVAEGEPFDLVSYIAEGDDRGKFWHRPAGEAPRLIERPNEYTGLALDERSLIVKIHGEVNREHQERDSYVISEDDYIDYLSRTDLNNLVPPLLLERLQKAHFLFLGYSLRDWNLRVILHRIAASRIMPSKSWAIMRDPADLDKEFWGSRDVKIFEVALDKYIEVLDERLAASAPAEAPVSA
jgi:SIR2-like domain